MNSKSVNRPVDTKAKEADIENKLRLYGIFQGFASGKLPSNSQIDAALSSFTSHPKLRNPNPKLSDEGKVILNDFRTVVEEAKRLLLVKNHDQAIQEFIYSTTQLGQKGGPDAGTPNAPVSKDTAARDAEEAKAGLRVLGELVITNGQFRKLLNDAVVLMRDIAGDSATKAAGRVRPDEDQLRQIDEPAPDHTWHEAPNMSRDNIKGQFREKFNKSKPLDRTDLRETAKTANAVADPYNSRDTQQTADRVAHDQRYGTDSGVDAATGLRVGAAELRDRVSENTPEEHKQRAREYRDRTREYMSDKMPKERRDQVIFRLKKMVVEIQSHQDYQQAIDTLLRLAENYSGHGKSLAHDGTGTVKSARQDSHLGSAENYFRLIIERFANNTSADDLFEAIDDIYRDADRDPELKEWFRNVNSYIRTCLKEEGYIMRDESNERYDRLYDQGNFLLRDRYRDHTDRVVNEFRFLGEQFAEDPDNKRFGEAMQKLFNDLGNDENGKPVFKKHLVKDVTQVIIPEIFENVRYVPIPRIEYSDPMMDAVVENLVIESDNLMPNVLEIGNDNYMRFGRKSVASKKRHSAMFSASGIQCDLRDVSYYIKRKQGFPSITDTGVADIFLGGEGFSFKLELATAEKHDRARFFKVENVHVTLTNMTIKLKQSKHKMMFNIFKPLLLKVVKPALTKVLEKQIRDTFGQLDALCYRIHQEQKKIETDLKNNPDPENVQNIYNRYYQAIQREMVKRKEQVAAKTEDKKVNVAITKQDSIFKNISLPGGISTRATHYKELAQRGDRWQSDVFNIGSASPTTGIPQPQPITRKSPHGQRRGLRERETASLSTSRDSGYHASGVDAYLGGPSAGYGNGATGFGDKYAAEQQHNANQRIGGYTLNQ
ncbi:hypothetical protein P167DRAFT_482247 [Morchella conica CCBAS932]|uniref:Uncharacterized protein n=1 Tax=Morchella conica CCBAS932 TaxID=1392247 RepID=A0A3N4KZL7_9PEZI|nr:hypothetical protein P167DRAFT_482247 [Morchella conica CCBAS932]